jgi:hypothetical protein
MTQHCLLSAGEQRRHFATVRGGDVVTDEVDAALELVEPFVLDSPED